MRKRTRCAQGNIQCSLVYRGQILRFRRPADKTKAVYFLLAPWLKLFGLVIPQLLITITAPAAIHGPDGGRRLFSCWLFILPCLLIGLAPFAIWDRTTGRPSTRHF